MHRFLALALLLAPLVPAKMPLDEFRTRRANLRKSLDGVVLLTARKEGRDEVFRVDQEPNFYYLTGLSDPDGRLLITPTREILFLPHHNERREHYMGKRSSAEDSEVHAVTGFEEVFPIEKFEEELDQALSTNEKVYALANTPFTDKLKLLYPFRDFSDAAPLIAKLRMKKSAAELAAIQHATDVSLEAHRAAWKRMASGLYEYQLEATLVNTFLENGCEGVSYAPIVGSGPNSTVLHYSANHRRVDQGEVVVIDSAAQCDGYASDITRTAPISGKFSRRQREIYEIVLGAQNAAIAAAKPGIRLSGPTDSLTKIAKDYMDAHGKDLHGEPLGKYFIHGIGHQVGLQVHDASVDGPLEAGMVVTIEPGIYIPEENIGVRIEDVILVTENGAKLLSAALPREPDAIEKAVAK
ncbi:MAG TPA: Xaa-Pro peptidase family protein [Bryobacteraceae bacterium]|jgi:Xaa-Pro aminopeptidase|nr:Xaa-Pro peptidase family protein [Bryobacteraceae bacterium]